MTEVRRTPTEVDTVQDMPSRASRRVRAGLLALDGAPTVDQPLPLPQGVSNPAVGNPVPEPELPLLIAAMLLGVALMHARRARHAKRPCSSTR